MSFGSIFRFIGATESSSDLKAMSYRIQEVAEQNATEMLALAGANAARRSAIAGINASAIRNTGYANAAAIERTAIRNGKLMMVEGAEIMRRHVRDEIYQVGNVRAMQAATGWSVNEGTPVIYKQSEKAEMKREREYIGLQQKLSLFTMLMNAGDEAYVTRYAADQSAGALLASAAIENEIMLAEAQAQYDAMIREGELRAIGLRADATSAWWGSLGDLVDFGISLGSL